MGNGRQNHKFGNPKNGKGGNQGSWLVAGIDLVADMVWEWDCTAMRCPHSVTAAVHMACHAYVHLIYIKLMYVDIVRFSLHRCIVHVQCHDYCNNISSSRPRVIQTLCINCAFFIILFIFKFV